MSSIAGRGVTEALEYDGGRSATVYVPPGPAEAVVFRLTAHGTYSASPKSSIAAAGRPR